MSNTQNLCPLCKKPKVPLFHSRGILWCPDCESDKKKHPKIGGKYDREEKTVKWPKPKDNEMWNFVFGSTPNKKDDDD